MILEQLKVYEEKTNKSLGALQSEYVSTRAGRANPHVLDKARVDCYGTPTSLQQAGNVTMPGARTIRIQPWEKNLLREIEKVIQISDLGINLTNDGSVIRLIFPELIGEYRKELAKGVKKKGEATKVAMRDIQRDAGDATKKLKKSGEISEDERDDAGEQTQKLVDRMMEKVDKVVEDKTKEIITV